MKEISRFQRNVEIERKKLKERYPDSLTEEEEKILYQKFSNSKQEPVRMGIALLCFFQRNGVHEKRFREELETFFRLRIRNTVEALIEEDAPEKIEIFAKQNWFGERELTEFIADARERKKSQSLIYLMTLKNNRYGYRRQQYEL